MGSGLGFRVEGFQLCAYIVLHTYVKGILVVTDTVAVSKEISQYSIGLYRYRIWARSCIVRGLALVEPNTSKSIP